MFVLRYLWPLPWTFLGLLLGVAGWVLGARWQRRHGVLECSGGLLGRWASHSPFAAITLGHVILATSLAQAQRLRAHEHGHVRQYECWGAWLVPAYLLAALWQWIQGRDPYADNPFEQHGDW